MSNTESDSIQPDEPKEESIVIALPQRKDIIFTPPNPPLTLKDLVNHDENPPITNND